MKRSYQFSNSISSLDYTQSAESRQKIADFEKAIPAGWRVFYWHKTGKFEVNLIARSPYPTPLLPDKSEVMEIFGSGCNHVESKPEFVTAQPGWRYWVVRFTPQERTVQALLLCPRAKCGCDPWMNARSSRQIYDGMRIWLEWLDKSL